MVNENDGKTRCTCRFARANYYARTIIVHVISAAFFFFTSVKEDLNTMKVRELSHHLQQKTKGFKKRKHI